MILLIIIFTPPRRLLVMPVACVSRPWKRKGDVIMVGGVSAGIAAVQRYNRKKQLEEEDLHNRGPSTRNAAAGWSAKPASGGGGTAVVSTLQLAMFCDRRGGQRDVLDTLNKLSQTADVNSPRGLSTLVNEVRCSGASLDPVQGTSLAVVQPLRKPCFCSSEGYTFCRYRHCELQRSVSS